MRRFAPFLVAAALFVAPKRAHADAAGETAAALLAVGGAVNIAFGVADVITLARHTAPGRAYAAFEFLAGFPLALTGVVGLAFVAEYHSAECQDAKTCMVDLGLSAGPLVVGGLITAHAVWTIATDGYGNAPRPAVALVPTLSVGGGGLALVGRF